MSRAYARKLARASEIAMTRATRFCTPRLSRSGQPLKGHRYHDVTSERKRVNLIEQGARPVLPTREWRAIYEEVGLA